MAKDPITLSVVIPLYDKRVSEESCLDSWCNQQTLDRDRYEVVVTSNGDDPAAEDRIAEMLRPPDRLVRKPGADMADLYHLGACEAKGELILFTELHCIADKSSLEELLKYLAEHPELAGACQDSMGGCPNTFARVERDLFNSYYEQWRAPGDWRKVVVRGVAIQSASYFDAGGFDGRYNRFADWILAANLHRKGHRLGFASRSRHLHYYSTSFSQFLPAVREHVQDECAYRANHSPEFCNQYFGTPAGWSQQRSFQRNAARKALRLYLRSMWRRPDALLSPAALRELGHWASLAATGLRWKLAMGWIAIQAARFRCWRWRNDLEQLKAAYQHAYRCIEDHYRLKFLAANQALSTPQPVEQANASLDALSQDALIGFYQPEQYEGNGFRWCRGVGIMAVNLTPAPYRLRIAMLDVRGNLHQHLLGVFINGRCVLDSLVESKSEEIVVELDEKCFVASGPQQLAITSVPIAHRTSNADSRSLGMPIRHLRFERHDQQTGQTDPGSATTRAAA